MRAQIIPAQVYLETSTSVWPVNMKILTKVTFEVSVFFFSQTAGIDTWNPARLSGKFMHAAILFLGTGQLQSTFVLARALRD